MKMLTTKHLPRPSNMLLKDYLRDDLSSCSSSGFKSFPRRQCFTTVRFDIQAKRNRLLPPTTTKPPRSSSSFKAASSTTLSALHKASQAVIKAVRLLPFPAISATSSNNKKKLMKTRLLSKSLSRKVLSRSFWRKAVKEEEKEIPTRRWRSFRDFLLEDADHKPSDQHAQSFSVHSESSNIKSDHNSWGSSEEFTWSSSSTANSTENDVVGSKENTLRNNTAVKAADENPTDAASTLHKAMDWGSEEKEQFSPVSVLDFPFDDEDISSPEGSKHKLIMKKSRHFDGIASVKPVELEERMALMSEEEEGIENEEEKVWRLVDEVIRSSLIPTSSKCLIMCKAEKKVLFDLFEEMRSEEYYNEGQVYKVAEEWVSGEFCEQVNLDGEMYIREMDKCGGWTNVSDEEWTQVGMDLECEIFTSLLNELLLEDS